MCGACACVCEWETEESGESWKNGRQQDIFTQKSIAPLPRRDVRSNPSGLRQTNWHIQPIESVKSLLSVLFQNASIWPSPSSQTLIPLFTIHTRISIELTTTFLDKRRLQLHKNKMISSDPKMISGPKIGIGMHLRRRRGVHELYVPSKEQWLLKCLKKTKI